ncbi:MAG: hypothetical protein Kow0098_15880 [Ignavibacteriaceae bacterium]
MIFILSVANENLNNSGSFYWSKHYFTSISKFIPENQNEIYSVSSGILYFNKSALKEKPALLLKIKNIQINNFSLRFQYLIDNTMKFKSYQVREAFKKYFSKKSVFELPFCAAAEEDKFFTLLNDTKIFSDISHFESKNDWYSVFKLLKNYQPLENSRIWDDAELLNRFSFATAKLSECSENLKKKFVDKTKLKEYLKEKRYYRNLTIKLRERCIQLVPDSPVFYSNLGYTFYQSVNELNTPGGRRDGKLAEEAEKAYQYLSKSISMDGTRITDLYRIAMLHSELLFNYSIYKKNDDTQSGDEYTHEVEMLKRGLNAFCKIERIYEELPDNDFPKKRFKKYYVKALYKIAQKKLQLNKPGINLLNAVYGNKLLNENPERIEILKHGLISAGSYINKCIEKDYNGKKKERYLLDMTECNNFICAVFKAYLKGVIETYLFALTGSLKHCNTAKDFFQKAMELRFPPEMRNQNKLFVLEKIALLNILEKKYEAAVKILEPLYNRRKYFPAYAGYTLAVSYILYGDRKSAADVTEYFLSSDDQIFEYKFRKLKGILLRKEKTNYQQLYTGNTDTGKNESK